jgi:hypothetical protein
MALDTPLADTPALGELSPDEAAEVLRELGETEAADALEADSGDEEVETYGAFDTLMPWRAKLYLSREHVFGYLPAGDGAGAIDIQPLSAVKADKDLRGAHIKLSLDALGVAAYPGAGEHSVLVTVAAAAQQKDAGETLHFSLGCEARDGEHAAVVGRPIFVGLPVGDEGLSCQCRTINVASKGDERLLQFIGSPAFKAGLRLASAAIDPSVGQVSGLAVALTKAVLERRRNTQIQVFDLSLDFSDVVTRGHLAGGSYIAAQIPPDRRAAWRWDGWRYDGGAQELVKADDGSRLPYNHVILGLAKV